MCLQCKCIHLVCAYVFELNGTLYGFLCQDELKVWI